jgi:Fe2+ transport system protein B
LLRIIAVALIQGMAAREVAVAALGTVYAIEGGKEAAEQIGHVLTTKRSLATALSLLAWYIFAPQCASTLAVIRRETGSWKWMAVTFALTCWRWPTWQALRPTTSRSPLAPADRGGGPRSGGYL